MSIQINGTDRINNSGKGIFAGVNLGSYTPNNRPSASTGDLIYNSTSKGLEVYNGSSWTQVGSAGPGTPYATGGAVTTNNNQYVHIFTSSGSFVSNKNISVQYLVIGGGGGGGSQTGGGGGAGGHRSGNYPLPSGTHTITVGAGGGPGGSGGQSAMGNYISVVGGGEGGPGSQGGSYGGSGGGGGGNTFGNPGGGSSSSYGNPGGQADDLAGGGGGGAGGSGGRAPYSARAGNNTSTRAGMGGSATPNSITGSPIGRAGGGGGGRNGPAFGLNHPYPGGAMDGHGPNNSIRHSANGSGSGGGGGGQAGVGENLVAMVDQELLLLLILSLVN